ncbi:MAG: hypothetical protein PHN69_04905 [Candidatus Pacebacteria bacterium]|nr:hypothetical protein [Candidatus Paceibacterota bacterium]
MTKKTEETIFTCECGGNIKVTCLECDCEVVGLNSYIQKKIEEVKKEAAEEIRVKLYEIISKHRIKELIPCQEDCLCWDIDNLKSFLEQKYAIGEK